MSFAIYSSYKPSGVEWLGEVPQHWRIAPLKYIVRFKSGGTPSKDNLNYWGGSIPWASAKDLKSEKLGDTLDHLTDHAIEVGATELVPEGAVLVLVRGMTLAHSFPVVLTLRPIAINQDLKAVIAAPDVEQEYLAWLLRGSARESLSRVDEAGHSRKGTPASRRD
jgi:type I restriction enzyme, S subunit